MDEGEGWLVRRAVDLLNKYHLVLVVLLSAMHIGLACIHTRDSGRAALTLSSRISKAVLAQLGDSVAKINAITSKAERRRITQ